MDNQGRKFLLFLTILAGCWYLGRIFHFDVAYYQDLLSRYPLALSGAVFVALYLAVTTFVWFGPKDVFRISSAILFGSVVSSVFIWVAEMFSAGIMFHMSRFLGRDYIRQKSGMKMEKLDALKDDGSLLGVVAWRVNPLLPFRVMDLGYGLTRIPFRKYFVGIAIVSFFRILWLQSIIAGIGVGLFKDASAAYDYFLENPSVLRYSMFYFLLVIVISAAALKARMVKKRNRP